MNAALSRHAIRQLLDQGVREFCVCPGARNSPLIVELKETVGVKNLYFFEERSAGFFAIGRIKSTGSPVAVVTTSGTAVANLLPATMEAHYAGLPLVLLTADRPRRFRGTGAPQTAEQVGLFGPYVDHCIDLAESETTDLSRWGGDRPLHLNLCFEEPLLSKNRVAEADTPRPVPSRPGTEIMASIAGELRAFLSEARHPLVVVGTLAPEEREPVARLLLDLGLPTYCEGPSLLREDRRLDPLRIANADRILARAKNCGYPIDAVLRIGGVPTHRLWRDLEVKTDGIAVLSISSQPFSGLSWAPLLQFPLRKLELQPKPHPGAGKAATLLERDRALARALETLLASEPTSEPGIFHALSIRIPDRSRVFIGNSLPIREWDLAASMKDRGHLVGASRGLNGIDGQVSTFLGYSLPDASCWGILGDLTTLYDLPGPWILHQLPELKINLVVINNGGGKIFDRMFPHPEFQNRHTLEFSHWAALWGVKYEHWEKVPQGALETGENRIIELVPDPSATERFWKAYEALL